MRRVPFRVKEDELIGRSSDITALASSLELAGGLEAIVGIAGVGKTMVAAAVAKKLVEQNHTKCAFFLQANSTNILRMELARFGRSYVTGCALDALDDDAIAAAQHFFASTTLEWVAVLDDVADLDEVRALVPAGTHGRLIFTSATDLGNPQDVCMTRLNVFTTQESRQLISKTTVKGKKVALELRDGAQSELGDLVERFCEEVLGNHPMTVAMVARALVGRDKEETIRFMKQFRRESYIKVEAEHSHDARYVRGVCGFVRVALAHIQQEHSAQAESARALMCILAVLPASGMVPGELFDSWDQSITELPYGKLFSTAGFDNAVAPLIEEGLVRQQMDGSVEVHSMLQRSSRALLRSGPEAEAISTLEVLFKRRFVDGSKNKAVRTHLRGLVGLPACLILVCWSAA
jgi:hypothetical protein